MSHILNYPVFDADNHMYETTDAFTKYLPREYEGLVKYVQVNGRTKIALRNVISDYIPNPTFNKVAPPGRQEMEFRLKNPSSKHSVGTGGFDIGSAQKADPRLASIPRYIESPPGFFNPEERIVMMDEQQVDRAMMWPTLASLLEERLADDPKATAVVVHALNEWMHEHWTFNFENRIFATPVINLSIVDEAIRELEYVAERGARAILIRPAPVPGLRPPAPVDGAAGVRPVLEAGPRGRHPRRHARLGRRLPALPQRVGRPHVRAPALHQAEPILTAGQQRVPVDPRHRLLDHRSRLGDPLPGSAVHAGGEREPVGPDRSEAVRQGVRAITGRHSTRIRWRRSSGRS